MDSIGRCESVVDDYLKSQLPSVVWRQIRMVDKMVESVFVWGGAWEAGGITNHMLTRLWSIWPSQPIQPKLPHVIFKLQRVIRARCARQDWQGRSGIHAANCINGMKLEPPAVSLQPIFYAHTQACAVAIVLPDGSTHDDGTSIRVGPPQRFDPQIQARNIGAALALRRIFSVVKSTL